jgi:hypothetical protein
MPQGSTAIPEFPEGVVEVTTRSEPALAAKHRRDLQLALIPLRRYIAITLLVLVTLGTIGSGVLVFLAATSGSEGEQRLAYGVLGTILGLLWGAFGKLLDTVMKAET